MSGDDRRYTAQVRLSPTRSSRLSRSSSILLVYGILTLASVLWGALRGHPQIYRLGPLVAERMLLNLCAGIALGLGIVFLSRYAVHRWQWARKLHHEFRHLLGPLTDLEIVVLAIASSVGEECFFRGALVPHIGLVASSGLFALAHIGPGWRFLPWTISSFVVGLLMGALFLWGGDLSGPVAAHFVVNYLNLHYIRRYNFG